MMRLALSVLLGSLWTAAAIAQTPLCAWNGTSLSCPNQPVPQGPLTPAAPFNALPTPQQRLAELHAQVAAHAARWPVAAAPAHQGIGTTVVMMGIRDQLGGKVEFRWRAEGLVCEMIVPIKA